MGMDAYLLCMGPFRAGITSALEYSDAYYEDTPEGGMVFAELFHCRTSEASRDLAHALGLSPWALGRHEVNPARMQGLRVALGGHPGIDEPNEDLIRLTTLSKEAGWHFYYRPNG